MAEIPTQTNSGQLAPPGGWGRAIRASLGFLTLGWLLPLVSGWREALFRGEVPLGDAGFWALIAFALWGTSYVFNITFDLSWGQRTRTGVVLGAGVAGLIGAVLGDGFPNVVFGVYLWAWFTAMIGLLGPALVLAAALGTPGCEMRSYAHALALLRGGEVATTLCPGGIDRLDHFGGANNE